jgi:hypothetical protein
MELLNITVELTTIGHGEFSFMDILCNKIGQYDIKVYYNELIDNEIENGIRLVDPYYPGMYV